MARHQHQDVSDASACPERAHDTELIRLCRDSGSTERAAVAHVQAWLCSWYGRR